MALSSGILSDDKAEISETERALLYILKSDKNEFRRYTSVE